MSPPAAPADLPLAGGRPGATVALSPLLGGEALGPRGWFERESGPLAGLKAIGLGVPRDQWVRVPVVAFLVEHPGAGPILIDTGLDRTVIDSPGQLGRINRLMLRQLRMTPEQTIPAQLADRGVDPAGLALIVMTHLHFDHASGLPQFPNATALVSEAEWGAATSSRSFLAGYHLAHLDPRVTYRTVNFEEPAARAWGPFSRTLDVFGDEAVRLVYTPGHSAGHLSVLLRLPDRYALVAGDAIYTMATLREGRRPRRSVDRDAFERSVAELEAFDREHADAVIVPGHDMAHWEGLAERYA